MDHTVLPATTPMPAVSPPLHTDLFSGIVDTPLADADLNCVNQSRLWSPYKLPYDSA